MTEPKIVGTLEARLTRTYPTEMTIVTAALKRRGIYRPNLLYKTVHPEDVPRLMILGSERDPKQEDSDTVICTTEKVFQYHGFARFSDIFKHPGDTDPAVVVYDGNQFSTRFCYQYRFLNPERKLDALVAVFFLASNPGSQMSQN